MSQFFDRFRGFQPSSPGEFFEALNAPLFPALDIADSDGVMEITAEIPGVQEDDLDVSISNGVLTLKGEKSTDHEEKEQDYCVVERRYGSFRRQVPLGFTPEDGAVKASFRDGVLKLKIAKPKEDSGSVQKINISKS
ncbi:MAG: Hsp20/alpha crystallin family protein [Alphaproteobacteria bacterium]|nr:Hsp20/alpha crystallin family protein [Alphaproteobacteria bacterium]